MSLVVSAFAGLTTEYYQSVFMGTHTGWAPALMQYVAAIAYKHCSKQALSNTPTF